MVRKNRDIFLACRQPAVRHRFASAARLGALASLIGTALVFAGCNDNMTTAAGPVSGAVPPPPTLHAHAIGDSSLPGALNAAWAAAEWNTFAPPSNSRSATPPTRAAIIYDNTNLYVSVIGQKSSILSADLGDSVSLFLDSEGKGLEILEISVDLAATASPTQPKITWYRRTAPLPTADNSSDAALPTDRLPNIKLTGISCEVRETLDNDVHLRSAFIGIPIRSLPAPFQHTPGTDPWKVNLIRTLFTVAEGKPVIERQSNVSPIQFGGPFASPTHMADLQFNK